MDRGDSSARASGGFGDYLGALRRRYIYVFTILPLVVLLCLCAAFGLPQEYESTATIMLEPSSIPKDIIESTVISYSDQQIEIVQGRVMTIDTLQKIVEVTDPYARKPLLSAADKAQKMLEDTTIERVDPVTLKPQAESNAFSLHYKNPDPAVAKTIDERLAQLFLAYNQERRTQAAGEAAGFLQKQAENLQLQMHEVDAQLVELKKQYGDALPDSLARNQAVIQDTQRQLDSLQQQILVAQEKETQLAVQLTQISPNLITQSGDLTDVATVRAKLTEAEQRYTPDHPEVKRLKHALEVLMTQQASGPATVNGVAPGANNPQYQTTAAELAGARNTLAGLQQLFSQARAKLGQYNGLVQTTPAAERAFSEVMRRRTALQNEYQETEGKLQSATLAKNFESQQGGERFTMIRAPALPRTPSYPNRLGIMLLGLVFGVALTGIAVAIAESSDRHIRTTSDLSLPENVPLLASIPFIPNKKDNRRKWIKVSSFVAAYSVAVCLAAAVIVFSKYR